jgi:molecular chaperone GrpE
VNDPTRQPVERPADGVAAPPGSAGGSVPADGEQDAAPSTARAPLADDASSTDDARGAEAAGPGDAARADDASLADDAPSDGGTPEGTDADEVVDEVVDEASTEADVLDIEALADSDPRSKAELLAELLAAEAKRDEYLDDLRRSHADFENYRRRVMRDGAVQRAAGKAEVAGALLEVLDDLDRTLAAAEGSPDQDLHTGIRLVAAKLVDALRQLGLQRIDEADVRFDPEVHEAVQQQPGEGIDGEPRVVTVLRPGYRMADRVLRAAMVAVEG